MIIQSSTNLNLGKHLLFATLAGSSLLAGINCEILYNQMPTMTVNYTEMKDDYSWENKYIAFNKPVDDHKAYDTILTFANKIVAESKDIDVDIQIAVNKIFWDLL